MSSLYGVESSYFAIRDYHQDLNVGTAGNNELVFASNPSEPMRWNTWLEYALFNKTYPRPSEAEEKLKNAINKQTNIPQSVLNNEVSASKNTPKTIYEIISAIPQLSKFKALIDEVGYGKFWDNNITIFAPINDVFDEVLKYPLNMAYRPVAALQTLRFHLLPFELAMWQIKNKKLRLRTDLNEYNTATVEIDYTGKEPILLNPIELSKLPSPEGAYTNPARLNKEFSYDGSGADPYSGRPDSWFPKKYWEVKILNIMEGVNGVLYIISRPIVPPDLF